GPPRRCSWCWRWWWGPRRRRRRRPDASRRSAGRRRRRRGLRRVRSGPGRAARRTWGCGWGGSRRVVLPGVERVEAAVVRAAAVELVEVPAGGAALRGAAGEAAPLLHALDRPRAAVGADRLQELGDALLVADIRPGAGRSVGGGVEVEQFPHFVDVGVVGSDGGAEGAGEAAECGEFAGVGLGGCGGVLGEDLGAVAVRQHLSVLEGRFVGQVDQAVADELVAGAHAAPPVSPTYRT